MTLSLSELTLAEKSLVPGSEEGKETLSGDDGLQVSLVVTGGSSGGGTVMEKHHSLSKSKCQSRRRPRADVQERLTSRPSIHSPPTLLCHKLVEASFDVGATTEAAVVGDWNVEKPVELFLW